MSFSDLLDEPIQQQPSFAADLLSGELPSQNIEDGSAGFVPSLKAGIVDDPQTKMRIFAETRFPDDPEALNRFGIVNNEMVFINEEGKLEKATGGFVDFLGGLAADTPEIAAGTAAGIATGSPVVGGALGGVVGKQAKQIAGNLIFDDPQTTAGNLTGQAKELGFGLVGGAVGEGFMKFLNRNVARQAGRLNTAARQEAIQTIADVSRETGIELDLAQVTDLPLLKAMKKWATKFPGSSSEVLDSFRQLQDGQAEQAIQGIMDTLGRETDATALGIKGMNAARASIEAARAEAAQIASPIYQNAFAGAVEVNPTAAIQAISEILPVAKGKRSTVLNRLAKEFVSNTEEGLNGDVAVETSLEALHNVKMHIDSLIDADPDVAVDKFLKNDLIDIQGRLLTAMDEASPLYAEARTAHGIAQERLVKPLTDSLVGTMARLQDQSAITVASKMFSGRSVSPVQINGAKRAIQAIERSDPALEGAWNGLVKQWFDESLNKATKELQSGQVVNFAGKFRQAVVGTNRQKQAIRAALGNESIGQFNQVMNAFEMMARTPIGGSDTAFNQLVSKELSEPSSVLKSIVSPLGTVTSAIDDRFMEANADKIAAALTNPENIDQLRQLTKISDVKERSLRLVTFVMGLEGGQAIDEALTVLPEDRPDGS